jgi:capsular polysaccharide export protein
MLLSPKSQTASQFWNGAVPVETPDVVGLRPDQRRFIFVTAPFGPFSKRLAAELGKAGARCQRVILNGGDLLDWGLGDAVVYRGEPDSWTDWIGAFFRRVSATDLIIHGAGYPHAAAAAAEARALGLRVHVFEEGYFRPHWITLERNGVNAASSLPSKPQIYLDQARGLTERSFQPVGRITPAGVCRLIAFHLNLFLATPLFPNFRLPYRYSLVRQSLGHMRRSLIQILSGKRRAKALSAVLAQPGPMFLALLQRPGDAQLAGDGQVGEVADFIAHVTANFARHAPADARLVFKAHPLDHGIERHGHTVQTVATAWGLGDRVTFVDGGRLPILARAARGVIVVNSTGGLGAIELGRPTLTLGQAIYDMEGLTHRSGLELFWAQPQAPDDAMVAAFRLVVMDRTQINGDFSTPAGIALAVPEAARRLLAD